MAAPEMELVDGTTAGSKIIAKHNDPWRKFHLGCFGRVNKELLVFKLYYFFLFSAQACAKPFLPVFFRHVGMSAEQTGMLLGLQPVARFVGAPLFGGLADKYRKHRAVMLGMCIVSTALFFCLVFVQFTKNSDIEERIEGNPCNNSNSSSWNSSKDVHVNDNNLPCRGINCSHFSMSRICGNGLPLNMSNEVAVDSTGKSRDKTKTFIVMSVLLITSQLFGNFNSLGDAATVKYLTAIDRGGDYGKQRLWGAVGWGSIAILSGFAIDESAKNLSRSQFLIAFCGFLLFSMATIATIFKLPLECMEGRANPKFFKNVGTILSDCRIATFLLAILIMGTCMETINMYLFWFLQDLNGSHLLMGLTLCMTCVAEVPIMFFSGHLIKRIGHHGVLYLTFVCYTIRYLSYSFIPKAWYVLVIEPLHGVTFGAMWAATTSYGGKISPDGLAATVMGLVTATHFGLGKIIAGFGGGKVYNVYGPRVLFRSLAITSTVTCLLFFLSQKLLKNKTQLSYVHFQNDMQDMNYDTLDTELKEISLDSGDEL